MTDRRVLYIQHAFALGGSVISLLDLARDIRRFGYEPVVACPANGPVVGDVYRGAGIETFPVHVGMLSHTTGGWASLLNPLGLATLVGWVVQLPRAVREIRSLINRINPDVVHLNSLTLAPYAPFLKGKGVPVVIHVRESVHSGHFGLRRAFFRYLVRKWCDEAIYICEHNRERLNGGGDGVVIYNSVDFSQFDRSLNQVRAREGLGLRPTDRVVLHLGGASEIKGILPLLRTVPKVAARVPNLVVLMPGAEFPRPANSPRRIARRLLALAGWLPSAELRAGKLSKRGEISQHLWLMAFSHDVPSLMAASDVVVFPSTRPHFPRPVMEAAAMGKPAVASRIGGVEEVVEDGVTGLLVEPGDPDALADALVKVLRDDRLAESFGEAAFRRARNRFDAEENTKKVVEIYEKFLDPASHPTVSSSPEPAVILGND